MRFLHKYLEKAGVSSVSLQKTPMATRIILRVSRPGIVAGRKGSSIRELCEILERKFGIDNPQLDIIEVERPQLDAQLVAEKIGKQVEVKGRLKQILRFTLLDIMKAGAIGAEIRAAGKIVGKGGKAKTLKVRAGYLKKSGDCTKYVRKGRYTVYLKAGAIGIDVQIVPPGVKFPDVIDVSSVKIEEILEEKAEAPEAGAEAAVEEKMAEAKAASEQAEKAGKKKAGRPRKKKEEKPAEKTEEKSAEKPAEKTEEPAGKPEEKTMAGEKAGENGEKAEQDGKKVEEKSENAAGGAAKPEAAAETEAAQ